MFIKIGGVPGAGKTTIAKLLIEQLKENGVDVGTIHGAEILAQILGVSLEELRILPENEKAGAREKMYQIMYTRDRENPYRILIRDAHFCMLDTSTHQFVTAPLQEEDFQQMKAVIVLDVPAEEILRRRTNDKRDRADRSLNIMTIEEEIRAELTEAKKQSKRLGIPLFIIPNHNRLPSDTCQEIRMRLGQSIYSERESISGSGIERTR